MAKYRICKRHAICYEDWYVVQKKRLFGWHTYNMSFRDISKAQEFITYIDYELWHNKIREIPLLIWDTHKRSYIEQCPFTGGTIKIR